MATSVSVTPRRPSLMTSGAPTQAVAEAVLDRAGQGRDRLLALAGIEGRRVGQKRQRPKLLDLLHHPPGKDRADVGVIPLLAEMDLDRRQVPSRNGLRKPGQGQQFCNLVEQIFLVPCAHVAEKDFRHGFLL